MIKVGKFLTTERIVILGWLIINLLNALFTQLYDDEAYYWVFSNHLDFGYFDHPPMIAVIIKLGYFLFQNELGVRLFPVILTTASFWIIYKLSETNNYIFFGALLISSFAANLFGFMALPDNPLLFFTALFFLRYKKFLEVESWKNIILLSICMAALLYSKYHGIFVIFFTLLSNIKLLQSKKFWLASILGALLFFPHLWWQYVNDFPSVQYHLYDRSTGVWKLSFTTDYLLGQLFFYAPFTGFLLFLSVAKYKSKNKFEKSLQFSFWGFLITFFLLSLKGKVEANWTIPILLPMIYFSLKYLPEKQKLKKLFWILVIPSVLLILFFRVNTIYPFMGNKIKRLNEFSYHQKFAEKVIKDAKGLPLFANDYQIASILSFYTKQKVHSLNIDSRKNQYDIWETDKSLHLKKIAIIMRDRGVSLKLENPNYNRQCIFIVDSFPLLNNIRIKPTTNSLKLNAGSEYDLTCRIITHSPVTFSSVPEKYATYINCKIYNNRKDISYYKYKHPLHEFKNDTLQEITFKLKIPDKKGKYKIQISMITKNIGRWSNWKNINLQVE